MRQSYLGSFWRWLALWFALAPGNSSFSSPVITEFVAANGSGLADVDGDFSDRIEIHNPDPIPISLDGCSLTDNAASLRQWTFPATTLDPGAYLIVFASGKDRRDPSGQLHTNFELSADGEPLALVVPDGFTVFSAYSPAYPPQFENQSFGLGEPASLPVSELLCSTHSGRAERHRRSRRSDCRRDR